MEIELTKSYPFNILLKKRDEREDGVLTEEEREIKKKEYYESNLVVYKKYEEENGDITNLGFHLDPYNFDSEDELQVFRYLRNNLAKGEGVKDVYFTGGITNEKHNDFYFEYLMISFILRSAFLSFVLVLLLIFALVLSDSNKY